MTHIFSLMALFVLVQAPIARADVDQYGCDSSWKVCAIYDGSFSTAFETQFLGVSGFKIGDTLVLGLNGIPYPLSAHWLMTAEKTNKVLLMGVDADKKPIVIRTIGELAEPAPSKNGRGFARELRLDNDLEPRLQLKRVSKTICETSVFSHALVTYEAYAYDLSFQTNDGASQGEPLVRFQYWFNTGKRLSSVPVETCSN